MAQPQRNISRKFTTQTGPCQPPGSKELNHGHTQARTLVARYLLRRRLLKKSDLLGCWLAGAFLAALITTAEAIYATISGNLLLAHRGAGNYHDAGFSNRGPP